MLRHDGVAEPRQRRGRLVADLGTAERVDQRLDRLGRRRSSAPSGSPAAPPPGPRPGSAAAADRRTPRATSAISRAASARSRAPAGPARALIVFEHRARRVEVLRRPRRRQKRRHARRGSRNRRSRRASRSAPSGSMPRSRERYSSASVRTPRSGSRSSSTAVGGDLLVAGRGQQRQGPPPDVRLRMHAAAPAAPGASSGCAAPRADRARSALRRDPRPPSLSAQRVGGRPLERRPTTSARYRCGGDGCCPGSCGRSRRAAARRRRPRRRSGRG